MEALVIGITATLGCVALGLGMFVLGKPPPPRPAEKAVPGTSETESTMEESSDFSISAEVSSAQV